MQVNVQELHNRVMETRRKGKEASKAMPRGNSIMTVFHLENEKIRLDVRTISERTEQHLLDCRKLARDLGIKLRETETGVSIPANATILYLFSIQLRAAYIPV